jgi:hypothetical protein
MLTADRQGTSASGQKAIPHLQSNGLAIERVAFIRILATHSTLNWPHVFLRKTGSQFCATYSNQQAQVARQMLSLRVLLPWLGGRHWIQ